MEQMNLVFVKALYLRFSSIFGDKFIKDYHNDEFRIVWYDEWLTGLQDIDSLLIKDALQHCRLSLEWPPSIAEFRKICETIAGMPSLDQALAMAIRQEFNHPVVKLASDVVGSWSMKQDKESVLREKFKAAYQEAVNTYRSDPAKAHAQLEEFKALPKALPIPSKIPSDAERKGFKQHYAEWKAKAAEEKAAREAEGGKPAHPIYEVGHVTIGHRSFDEAIYNERKRYLLGLKEHEAATLPSGDWYDRVKFLREIEAHEHLKRVGYTGNKPTAEVKDRDTGYQARKTYKNWFAE